jgi:hypothetical protein
LDSQSRSETARGILRRKRSKVAASAVLNDLVKCIGAEKGASSPQPQFSGAYHRNALHNLDSPDENGTLYVNLPS